MVLPKQKASSGLLCESTPCDEGLGCRPTGVRGEPGNPSFGVERVERCRCLVSEISLQQQLVETVRWSDGWKSCGGGHYVGPLRDYQSVVVDVTVVGDVADLWQY